MPYGEEDLPLWAVEMSKPGQKRLAVYISYICSHPGTGQCRTTQGVHLETGLVVSKRGSVLASMEPATGLPE